MKRIETNPAIDRAIQAAGGRLSDLAAHLGVSQQAVSLWRRQRYVPWRRALVIEARYGVPRHELVDPRLIQVAGSAA